MAVCTKLRIFYTVGRPTVIGIVGGVTALIFCAAIYLLFPWEGQWMQLCAAVFAGLVAVLFATRVYLFAHLRYSSRIENPFRIALPLRIVRDCLILAWVPLRNLFGARVFGRVLQQQRPEKQLYTTTARAATIAAICFAPNTYVLDAGVHSVVVHELVGPKKEKHK